MGMDFRRRNNKIYRYTDVMTDLSSETCGNTDSESVSSQVFGKDSESFEDESTAHLRSRKSM